MYMGRPSRSTSDSILARLDWASQKYQDEVPKVTKYLLHSKEQQLKLDNVYAETAW